MPPPASAMPPPAPATPPQAPAVIRPAAHDAEVPPAGDHADTVVFDIDGTLVDSTYHHALAWHRAFRSLEIPAPVWRVHRAIGMGGDRIPTAVAGADAEDSHGDELRARWRREYDGLVGEVGAFAAARDLLTALRERGWRVALGSSGPPDLTAASVDLLGARDRVDAVTSSEDADSSKPAPDIFAAALAAAGGRAAVCVGDSPYDVQAAREIDAACIGVRTGGYSTAELVEAGAVLVVDDVEHLLAVLTQSPLAHPRT